MDYRRLTRDAIRDVDDIWDYIAQDSVDAADRMVHETYDAVSKLAAMPTMEHRREDLTGRPVRFWPVKSYLIIYRVDVDPIEVVRIVSGFRDIKELLG